MEIKEVSQPSELQVLEELFAGIWEVDSPPITADLMRALAHSGNYVVAAVSDGSIVGAAVAFMGREPDGEVILHSHIMGVLPVAQTRGTGFDIKQHQRLWALNAGIKVVVWTFDPLVRRNAYFNLVKLGAEATRYKVHFYGDMEGINAGDESDRLVIRWRLDSPAAEAAAAGNLSPADLKVLLGEGAAMVLRDDDGEPFATDVDAEHILCQVPEDIIAMRSSNPDRALRWRRALRKALSRSLDQGYRIAGFTRDGWYVLQRGKDGG